MPLADAHYRNGQISPLAGILIREVRKEEACNKELAQPILVDTVPIPFFYLTGNFFRMMYFVVRRDFGIKLRIVTGLHGPVP